MTAGRRIPVEKGRVDGAVDELVDDEGTFKVGGWAIDQPQAHGWSTGSWSSRGRGSWPTAGRRSRAPISRRPRRGLVGKRPGFRLNPTAADVKASEVRVFAISGGVASELRKFKLE